MSRVDPICSAGVGPLTVRSSGRPEWTIRVVESQPAEPTAAEVAALAELDEPALVQACLSGMRQAFDILVERHRRAVYQLCYRYVGNHEDASDLTQDVFLRAYRGLKSFRGQASLGTWLYRIGVNVCLNKVSARKPPTQNIDENAQIPDTAPDPLSNVFRAERAVQVREAIAKLPERQRTTLILRMYHEMSHQEIADVLGSSVGAVKANFFHALNNLKRILHASR
ncbi:MAG: sigma-70 family RNA polymerase sigma factor [Acidobacteria bacterium]|nr:sigma-70 family RNA polymerase sigma factor [Acidobacteriota bacterium]